MRYQSGSESIRGVPPYLQTQVERFVMASFGRGDISAREEQVAKALLWSSRLSGVMIDGVHALEAHSANALIGG